MTVMKIGKYCLLCQSMNSEKDLSVEISLKMGFKICY